ncbi:type II toxin-antitoxin system RelE/ParE family toxin [Lichenicoccus sp.]|uniref:type II toxin-antitoxin system RelE/ParE family toxin n=1 Tax=Lichenicoccus sp. TaxID=2781899 RepID=UPI003D0FAAB1
MEQHPQIGRAGRIVGTRELVVSGTPYILVYFVADEAVQVLRVLHSSQQWPE